MGSRYKVIESRECVVFAAFLRNSHGLAAQMAQALLLFEHALSHATDAFVIFVRHNSHSKQPTAARGDRIPFFPGAACTSVP